MTKDTVLGLLAGIVATFAFFSFTSKSTEKDSDPIASSVPMLAPSVAISAQSDAEQSPIPANAVDDESPKATVKDTTYDFVEAERGMLLRHSWEIENTGKGLLKIFDLQSSCGCVVHKVSTKEVAPGQTAMIEAALNTSMKRGIIDQPIMVVTNDEQSPRLVLAFKGKITSRVEISPERLNLPNVPAEQSLSEGKVEITTNGGLEFDITGTRTSKENVIVDYEGRGAKEEIHSDC